MSESKLSFHNNFSPAGSHFVSCRTNNPGAGGDRSGVTGGPLVSSDQIVVKVTATTGNSFLDRTIALDERAIRQRTPNEIALSIVLSAFTLIFLIVTAALWPMALNAARCLIGGFEENRLAHTSQGS